MDRILITGASGFLGSHVVPVFNAIGKYDIVSVNSKDYDLTDERQVEKMFSDIRPDYVVHLAAKSGGILSNRKYPADYFHQNILLITHMYKYSHINKVKNLLVPMGGCSYPATAPSPIIEDDMWNGYPQKESAGYSSAKKSSLVLQESYLRQYGFKSVVIVPGNMYGEYDNYSLQESHVVPAMIRKFHSAKLSGEKSLTFWGTGSPLRDFVYAQDVADLFPFFLFEYEGSGPVNVSSGTSVSIKELASAIAALVGFDGDIVWDSSYPDGQMVKIFSVDKLQSLGKRCATSLVDGLKNTIGWYTGSYPEGIRL